MSKLFNIFHDSSSEEECDCEDNKNTTLCAGGKENEDEFVRQPNQRLLAQVGRVISDITECQRCSSINCVYNEHLEHMKNVLFQIHKFSCLRKTNLWILYRKRPF